MFNTMHLFAGAGGGLLADLILGHSPIVAVEWDKHACAVLRERTAQGWFPGLHMHEGDVRMFDPSPWAGRVDCIHAGFPCQDISTAGLKKGINGDRSSLYIEALRIADVVRPRYIFMENVAAIVADGMGTVLGDLAARGYDARWTVLAAADVGAPHIRERWWCLGWRESRDLRDDVQVPNPYKGGIPSDPTQPPGAIQKEWIGVGNIGDLGSMADADKIAASTGARTWSGAECSESRDNAGRGGKDWTGGWWSIEPDVGRMAHGVAHRMDRIAAIGNGQVPLCAAAAWKILGGPMNHEATPNDQDQRARPADDQPKEKP